MSRRELKLPLTPITINTFERQGWTKHMVGDVMGVEEIEEVEESDVCYYTLTVPKTRDDLYTMILTSNATDETGLLKDIGLAPNTFFVEIMGTDSLGHCTSEEELEILYKVLTGEDIEK
jgi:hypothetical protein